MPYINIIRYASCHVMFVRMECLKLSLTINVKAHFRIVGANLVDEFSNIKMVRRSFGPFCWKKETLS